MCDGVNAGVIAGDDCMSVLNASDLVVLVCVVVVFLRWQWHFYQMPRLVLAPLKMNPFCRSRAVLFWDSVVAGAKLYMLFYCSSRFLRGGFLFLKHCRSLITPLVAFGMPVTAKFNAGLGGFKTKCKIIAQKQFFFLLVRLEMSLLSNTGVGLKPWDCLLIPT